MGTLKNCLPIKIYEIIEKVGITTPKQILIMTPWHIKKLTNLNSDDVALLTNVAAELICPLNLTSDRIIDDETMISRVSTGSLVIDEVLDGGLRKGTLTELFGVSGSGKTQIGLQAAIYNWSSGTVYICTEDLFPIIRYEQLKNSLPNYNTKIDYGKNIFVEHITESHELLACVRVRLPKLLSKNHVSLIVIDSVAAPFRCENINYVQRAEELRELAMKLIILAQQFNLAVLCINQVTSSFEGPMDNIIPSLGLAWSNMISTRMWLKKTRLISRTEGQVNSILPLQVREISTVFAPDVPTSTAEFVITAKGLEIL